MLLSIWRETVDLVIDTASYLSLLMSPQAPEDDAQKR